MERVFKVALADGKDPSGIFLGSPAPFGNGVIYPTQGVMTPFSQVMETPGTLFCCRCFLLFNCLTFGEPSCSFLRSQLVALLVCLCFSFPTKHSFLAFLTFLHLPSSTATRHVRPDLHRRGMFAGFGPAWTLFLGAACRCIGQHIRRSR